MIMWEGFIPITNSIFHMITFVCLFSNLFFRALFMLQNLVKKRGISVHLH